MDSCKYLFLFACLLFLGCNRNETADVIPATKYYQRSFTLKLAEGYDDIVSLRQMGNRLITDGHEGLLYFSPNKKGDTFRLTKEVLLPGVNEHAMHTSFFVRNDNSFILGNNDDLQLKEYDSTGRCVKKYRFDIRPSGYGKPIRTINGSKYEVLTRGDTFYSYLQSREMMTEPEARLLNREPMEGAFVFEGDSVRLLRQFGYKPADFYGFVFHPFCRIDADGDFLYLFPHLDSVFSFNPTTQQHKTYALNNRFFSQPAPYNYQWSRVEEEDYFATAYSYDFIYHSARTGNNVILFEKKIPFNKTTKRPEKEVPRNFALLLDPSFHIKEYLQLKSNHNLRYPIVIDSCLAIPVYDKEKLSHQSLQYDVFMF